MSYADKEILKYLAEKNYRGWRTPDLVCELQCYQDKLADIEACPDLLFPLPSGCTKQEYFSDTVYFLLSRIWCIENEIDRRDKIQPLAIRFTNENILEAVKDKLGGQGLVDVISRYTKVYHHQKIWSYECPLHGDGQDKHASGVIYPEEKRYWCFVCNRGGDVFDVVCNFERVKLPEAITRLAKEVGIEPRPIEYRNLRKTLVKENE